MNKELKKSVSLYDIYRERETRGNALNKEQRTYIDSLKAEISELGINMNGADLIIKRDLQNDIKQAGVVKNTTYIYDRPSESLLNQFRLYEDLDMRGVGLPYVDDSSWFWKEAGFGTAPTFTDPDLREYRAEPHRLVSQVEVSSLLFKQNKNLDEQLYDYLLKSMENKALKTLFSTADPDNNTDPDNDDLPAGIFRDITVDNITSIDDIKNMLSDVSDKNIKGKWFLSGKNSLDFISLFKDYGLMDRDILFGYDKEIVPYIESGYGCFIDPSKINFCQYSFYGLTFDIYTKAAEGKVLITVEGYYDFKYLSKCIKYFKIVENTEEPITEEPITEG